ncbi:glycoside hydrolase family 36 protein [Clostridium estertheticum]|uniref:glycoside hydrolase family 36 protein n=1 Tax=Clostridium estertheticum TaxID=238834 RepID=UPI001CF5C640|nr:glycoside hydrolase family 36 protein [Clostridium estertheticum]MCB2356471.1 alpha-galactosidase [Clostridium estertheticum]WAG43842.1 alpha-galactosidase [Clostridium estertheticum]
MIKKIVNLGEPSWITIETDNEKISKGYEKNEVYVNDVEISLENSEKHLSIYLSAIKTPVKYVKLRWNLKLSKKGRILGDEWERGYGYMGFRGMSANRILPWYFIVSQEDKTYGYGVAVQPSAMCFWQVDTEGITLFLDVRCGGDGVLLNGRKLKMATVISMEIEEASTFEAAEEFCREMCPNPRFPDHPVYGSNNWYYAYGDSSEKEILSDTDYVVRLTKGAENPPYMVIDDCWQEHHRLNDYNGGPWTKGNSKFPNMKELAEKLSEKGVRPGIWVRLLLNEDEKIPQDWRLPLNGCLDPTHPKALEYIKEDVKRICEWGYTLIKHDFSTFDLFGRWGFEMNPLITVEGWHFYDRSKTSAEVVKILYKTILDTAKPYNTIILGCNTIGHLGAGLMHINRTGDDTSGMDWERTRQIGINTLAFRLPQHKTFYDVDADCVGIAGNIDWEFNKQWADVLAESGTPLFLSAKPYLLNETEEEELRQIMIKASKQEHHKIPTDWKDTDCPEVWKEGECKKEYHWYEKSGLHYKYSSIRYESFLSIE